ncbi:MAG: hypothetical protein R8K53_00500 [Mariprofundaceae bacterium]
MNKTQKKPIAEIGYTWAPYWLRGVIAFVLGAAVYQGGMLLLGVHLEWFSGIAGFDFAWLLAMSVLPFATGILIGAVYGFGGKYLAHFPPAMMMLWTYQQSYTATLPDGVHLIPWGLWVVFVILQMEFCAVGGFIGEILVRKRFSWDREVIRTADSEPLPDDDFSARP